MKTGWPNCKVNFNLHSKRVLIWKAGESAVDDGMKWIHPWFLWSFVTTRKSLQGNCVLLSTRRQFNKVYPYWRLILSLRKQSNWTFMCVADARLDVTLIYDFLRWTNITWMSTVKGTKGWLPSCFNWKITRAASAGRKKSKAEISLSHFLYIFFVTLKSTSQSAQSKLGTYF